MGSAQIQTKQRRAIGGVAGRGARTSLKEQRRLPSACRCRGMLPPVIAPRPFTTPTVLHMEGTTPTPAGYPLLLSRLAVWITPVLCSEVPSYDPVKYCSSLVAAAAAPQIRDLTLKGCLEQERRQKELERLVQYLSADAVQRCDALARMSTGGSYQMFAGCAVTDLVDQLLESKIDVVLKR
jgi:hypothetical protein